MCGIFGFVADHPRAVDFSSSELDTGLTRIRHRGPDGTGTWVSPNGQVGLGHVRLSIIDLEGGRQPMSDVQQRIWLVFRQYHPFTNHCQRCVA